MSNLNYQSLVMFKTMTNGNKQFLRYNSTNDVNGFTLVTEDQVDSYCIFRIHEENPNNTDPWCYSGNTDANSNGCHGNFRLNCPKMSRDFRLTSVNFDNRSNLINVPGNCLYAGIGQGPAYDYETFICFNKAQPSDTGPISNGDTLYIRNLNRRSSNSGDHRQYLGVSSGQLYANVADMDSATPFIVQLADYTTWMTDCNIQGLTLPQIMIPGTHDSGSYSLVDDVPSSGGWYLKLIEGLETVIPGDIFYDYVKGWSITQTVDIQHQLILGARYLDLRVCEYQNEFHTHHGLVGAKISDIFDQILSYLDSVGGSNEIVIIRVGHMDNLSTDQHKQFVNMIKSQLGKYLYTRSSIGSLIGEETIGTITADGPRVIVIYDDPNFEQLFHFELAIWGMYNIWDGFQAETSVPDLEQQRLEIIRAGSQNIQVLTEIQWIITPPDSGSAMIAGLMPGFPSKLVDYSDGCNEYFLDFVEMAAKGTAPSGFQFVFIGDFIMNSSLVAFAKDYNTLLGQAQNNGG